MDLARTELPLRIRIRFAVLAAGIAFAAALAAGPAAQAAAPAPAPASSSAPTYAPAPEAAEAPRPKMVVRFPARTATVLGTRALVYVRCTGPISRVCIGTLALRGRGGSHKVAFSLERGETRPLVVPLASEAELAGPGAARVQAVAETMQATGSSVTTRSILRVK